MHPPNLDFCPREPHGVCGGGKGRPLQCHGFACSDLKPLTWVCVWWGWGGGGGW